MSLFREIFQMDLKRYTQIDPYTRRWHYLFRKCQQSSGGGQIIWHRLLLKHSEKHGIEFDYPVTVGAGLYIGHPYGITVNDKVVIGRNCNIHKGVTIGRENRGSREGTPTIGDNVWIGINATVVGKIAIGDDVLIAPNSFVNFDVPSHSIVIGNPAKVISKENATQFYINNMIGEET